MSDSDACNDADVSAISNPERIILAFGMRAHLVPAQPGKEEGRRRKEEGRRRNAIWVMDLHG
jgi:hypothetical protein